MHADVIILGAGAAGLFCAAEAARDGLSVLVLEHQDTAGKKIRISGGGRCNFTNLHAEPAHYLSSNPHFCVSALRRFTPEDFLARVEAAGIAWHEKTDGQLFCDGSAQQIIDLLLRSCSAHGVQIRHGWQVEGMRRLEVSDPSAIRPSGRSARFRIATSHGACTAHSVVVATGGLSMPTLGASPIGYRIAESFGLPIVPPRAALVPFTWRDDDRARYSVLAGVSCDVAVHIGEVRERGALLFTHRGLSGPAILQSSLLWRPGMPVCIDLLPGVDLRAVIADRRSTARDAASMLAGLLPRRISEAWCAAHAPAGRAAHWSARDIDAFAAGLHAWEIHPAGTEGWRTAEVTAGGVDTRALSSQTMEARRVPGLYFIGEVVDVTGRLGGFNFQWAWSSAVAAARGLQDSIRG